MFEYLASNLSNDECPMDMLFMETILIPPSKFRPIRFLNGERFESPLTTNYRMLLESDEILRLLHRAESQGLVQQKVNVSCQGSPLLSTQNLGIAGGSNIRQNVGRENLPLV